MFSRTQEEQLIAMYDASKDAVEQASRLVSLILNPPATLFPIEEIMPDNFKELDLATVLDMAKEGFSLMEQCKKEIKTLQDHRSESLVKTPLLPDIDNHLAP